MLHFFCSVKYFWDSFVLLSVSVCSLLSSVRLWVFHSLFIHSLVEGPLRGFQKHSRVGFCLKASFHFSWVNTLGTGLLDLRLSMFNFIRYCQIVFQSGCVILFFQQQCIRVPVVHLYQHLLFLTPWEFEVASLCSFNLHFLMSNNAEHLFFAQSSVRCHWVLCSFL